MSPTIFSSFFLSPSSSSSSSRLAPRGRKKTSPRSRWIVFRTREGSPTWRIFCRRRLLRVVGDGASSNHGFLGDVVALRGGQRRRVSALGRRACLMTCTDDAKEKKHTPTFSLFQNQRRTFIRQTYLIRPPLRRQDGREGARARSVDDRVSSVIVRIDAWRQMGGGGGKKRDKNISVF